MFGGPLEAGPTRSVETGVMLVAIPAHESHLSSAHL